MAQNFEAAVPEDVRAHPAWMRLEDQLAWYDGKSIWNQKWHKRLRLTQVVIASAIPIVALTQAGWSSWASAIFGASIAVLEAVQHLNQLGPLWIEYRATAEHLKHEKFLFLSQSGHYRDLEPKDALRLLAEQVEEHVSTEHARWIRTSKKPFEEKPKSS